MIERADSAIVAEGYDGRERYPQIFNLQFSIVNPIYQGMN